MNRRKAMLIYNGNAGQKNVEKTLGAAVPVLSQAIDELIVKPTRKNVMHSNFAGRSGRISGNCLY